MVLKESIINPFFSNKNRIITKQKVEDTIINLLTIYLK